MFTFSLTDIGAVLARGRADAAANGGFRLPYQGISPEAEARAGLWLVGDESVYVLSNGQLAEGQRPLVIYAEECDRRPIRITGITSDDISVAMTGSNSSTPSNSKSSSRLSPTRRICGS